MLKQPKGAKKRGPINADRKMTSRKTPSHCPPLTCQHSGEPAPVNPEVRGGPERACQHRCGQCRVNVHEMPLYLLVDREQQKKPRAATCILYYTYHTTDGISESDQTDKNRALKSRAVQRMVRIHPTKNTLIVFCFFGCNSPRQVHYEIK